MRAGLESRPHIINLPTNVKGLLTHYTGLTDSVLSFVGFPIILKMAEGFKAPAEQKRIVLPFKPDGGVRHFAFAAVIIMAWKDSNIVRQAQYPLKGTPLGLGR